MAKGTSSSHRAKGEENNAAKTTHKTMKGSKVSNAVKVGKSGLRKSASEDSSKKKIITRSISSRKCEGIERNTPATPIVKRKSAINEKHQTPSPLRRSERGKKQSSPASSGLKKSDRGSCSSDIKHRQERKEKRAKVLKLESGKISRSAENNLETEQVKENRIDKREDLKTGDNDARSSKTTLRRSNAKSKFMLEVIDNNNVAECASQKHVLGEEASEHEDGIGDRLCKSDSSGYAFSEAMVKQTPDEHERADLDFSEKVIQIASRVAINSPVKDSTDDQIDLEKNCEISSLKRKRNYVDTYFDDSAVVGRTKDCISTAELPSPSSSFCLHNRTVETCETCFKRQRTKNDTMNEEICLCSTLTPQELAFIDVYGVVHEKPEASGTLNIYEICYNSEKQNEPSVDLGTNLDQNECFTCKLGGKLRMNDDAVNNEICLFSTPTLQAVAFIDVCGVVHEKPEASGSMKSFENCDNSTKQNVPSADLGTNPDQNACFPNKLGGKHLFVEYWVPAQISHVQLEQYCSNLLLNSTSLCSSSRNDHVGALRDILISTRKCCNHPYILDPSLQALLTNGREVIEYLDVGIEASGKLQLLDVMLVEMKKRGLRVLILFKSNSGSGRDSIGDILDDFLRQRFGADSYERVEGGLLYSKKLAALNKFNDNESQRFVFLLEFRACLPSIKLSSVDSVIIYDSDWTPVNDLRALQKITIDPQFDQIKIFRLYSSCTVEERVLMLALQNKTVDNSLINISTSTSHTLLMWGASHLFDNLEKFHESNISSVTTPSKESLLQQDVMHDLVSVLPNNDESSGPHELVIMVKAQQVEGRYHTGQPLFGELQISQKHELLPHLFWCKLLKGKYPRWKFSSVPCRNRKRAHCQPNDELPMESDLEGDTVVKRRKKVLSSEIIQPFSKVGLEEETSGRKMEDGPEDPETLCSPRYNDRENNLPSPIFSRETSNNITGIIEDAVIDEERELCGTQTSLYHRLRPRLLKLCQILQLPKNVKRVVKKLSVYVVDNHHVDHETTTMQQAFQLALCWTAAYWVNYKINHKESMALAREKLNFDCKREEADFVYLKLRCLRIMFLCNLAEQKIAKAPVASEIPSIGDRQNLPLKPKLNLVRLEVEDLLQSQSVKQIGLQLEMDSALVRRDVLKSVKLIKKKCRKQLSKLIEKQHEQKNEVRRNREEEILQMEKSFRVESAVIRQLHGKSSIGIVKHKKLDMEFSKKIEDWKSQMEICLKVLEGEQLAARNKVHEKEARLVEELKSWAQVELLNKQSLNKTRQKSSLNVSDPHSSKEFSNNVVENLQELREKNSEVSETTSYKPVEYSRNVNADPCRHFTDPNDIVEVDAVCEEALAAEVAEDNLINPSDVLENVGTLNSCSKAKDSDVPTTCSNGASTGIHEGELLKELSNSIHLSVGLDRDMPINQEKNPSEAAPIILNEEVPLGVSLSTPENLATFEDQNAVDATAIIPDEEILIQSLQAGSDYVAENNNCVSINEMNLSVSDYGLEINQQDSLSNVNSQIILSNEMSPMNLPAVLPSETILTQGTPVPSNQGQVILPVLYPESLFRGTLMHSAEASSSCFNSSQQAAVNFVAQPQCNLDPLQNELERLRKEAEDLIKASHEKNLQLKSDCEKEMAEVIAQIQSKYNTKLQDNEAEVMLRKKEVYVKYHKVLMNKRLAFAFRSKCIDLKLARTPGFHQDVISNVQPRHQLQQTARRPPPVQIPTASPSSNLSPSSFQPISLDPNPHPLLATNRSALPNRPPLVSSVLSSTVNLHVDGAIRSPAPHLQPFRSPPATISSSSFPRHTPSLQAAISRPPSSFPSYPQLQPQFPLPSNLAAISRPPSSFPSYPQLQPQFPLPSNLPLTCGAATTNMSTPNSSLSALGLFMDMNTGAGLILPNSADICSNLNASSTLPAGTTNNTQVSLRDGGDLDIVCLSDDE